MSNTTKVQKLRALILKPIFDAMDAKSINRSKIAQRYGITRSMLYQYETGRLQVPNSFIDWFLKDLGLPPETIPSDARGLIERPARRQAKGA